MVAICHYVFENKNKRESILLPLLQKSLNCLIDFFEQFFLFSISKSKFNHYETETNSRARGFSDVAEKNFYLPPHPCHNFLLKTKVCYALVFKKINGEA